MVCRLIGAKPLSEPMLEYLLIRTLEQWNLKRNSYIFIQEIAFENVVWKISASVCFNTDLWSGGGGGVGLRGWGCTIYRISVRNCMILNSNLAKSRASVRSISVVQFNCFEILLRARQYHCRALWKISKRLGNCKISYGQTRLCEIWI